MANVFMPIPIDEATFADNVSRGRQSEALADDQNPFSGKTTRRFSLQCQIHQISRRICRQVNHFSFLIRENLKTRQ